MSDRESYLKRYIADDIKGLCVANHKDNDDITSDIERINALCDHPHMVVPGAQPSGPAPVSTTDMLSILTSSCLAMNPVILLEIHNLHK